MNSLMHNNGATLLAQLFRYLFMQLAISVLGDKKDDFIAEILSAISTCHCSILEFRTSNLADITSVYVLTDGNWNYVAKLEALLEIMRSRFQLQISFFRPQDSAVISIPKDGVPYTLETISTEKIDLLFAVTTFLLDRGIYIVEISANLNPALLFDSQIFSTRLTLQVPSDVRILSLREEFLDFCDNLNIDAILEPIKR